MWTTKVAFLSREKCSQVLEKTLTLPIYLRHYTSELWQGAKCLLWRNTSCRDVRAHVNIHGLQHKGQQSSASLKGTTFNQGDASIKNPHNTLINTREREREREPLLQTLRCLASIYRCVAHTVGQRFVWNTPLFPRGVLGGMWNLFCPFFHTWTAKPHVILISIAKPST